MKKRAEEREREKNSEEEGDVEKKCVFEVNFSEYNSVHWNDESINYNLTIVKQKNPLKSGRLRINHYWLHSYRMFDMKKSFQAMSDLSVLLLVMVVVFVIPII